MITRRTTLALLASVFAPWKAFAAYSDSDFFKEKLEKGDLPPVDQRLPKNPRVLNMKSLGREPGKHGGSVRMLIGGQRDIRLMPINSYARLVGYDESFNFQPDILESYNVDQERVFTLKLRDGHKWSDGSDFTTEDFRYFWEDVALNREIHKGGPPIELLVYDKPPMVEVVDRLTVRYSWDGPNPDFLAKLAGASPARLCLPAAYMKQFHAKYQTEEKLAKLIKKNKVDDWSSLHVKMSRQVRPENPDLPTLDAWRNVTSPPSEQFIFERNPYYHRVDENGLQLPYLDRFLLNVTSSEIIAAKTASGDSDLQFMGLDFNDYTFLRDAQDRYPIKVNLWKRSQGSRVCLLPNLNAADNVWRNLFRDVRMRRALSVAIDRHEINMVCFYGLAKESADTVLPESSLFRPEFAKAWADFNPAMANALLDELGLTKRNDKGVRLLPDGRPAHIIVETAGESTLETDVLELVTDHWRKIGISLSSRPTQRDVFRKRAMGGEVLMSVWFGMDNAVPTPDMLPAGLAPTGDDQLQWPVWGIHYLSGGREGKEPDLPEAEQLLALLKKWRISITDEERREIWLEMLSLYSQQVFSIGIVNSALQPIVHVTKMRNVPEKALYGFEPTSYLGVYMPDAFWYDGDA
ncbi:putative ABC transporter-binding protein precursor [Agrobacterium sp. DSM 25558]|uniref:ABC transporter substrate-binding protein n=1 Tax=Agrobacterium sp. DSM 25558 TaxID=1907665 RepID=UPI00097254F7|nr:ABC transporter substrate-binding protein [Agrobacterium sp. DSM 25558]SCX09328.1 putative ABC transporter-binding protein precursor [Agrobacterium sp. DSM 25558]